MIRVRVLALLYCRGGKGRGVYDSLVSTVREGFFQVAYQYDSGHLQYDSEEMVITVNQGLNWGDFFIFIIFTFYKLI